MTAKTASRNKTALRTPSTSAPLSSTPDFRERSAAVRADARGLLARLKAERIAKSKAYWGKETPPEAAPAVQSAPADAGPAAKIGAKIVAGTAAKSAVNRAVKSAVKSAAKPAPAVTPVAAAMPPATETVLPSRRIRAAAAPAVPVVPVVPAVAPPTIVVAPAATPDVPDKMKPAKAKPVKAKPAKAKPAKVDAAVVDAPMVETPMVEAPATAAPEATTETTAGSTAPAVSKPRASRSKTPKASAILPGNALKDLVESVSAAAMSAPAGEAVADSMAESMADAPKPARRPRAGLNVTIDQSEIMRPSLSASLPPTAPRSRPPARHAEPSLASVPTLGPGMLWRLGQAGIHTLSDLAAEEPAALKAKLGPVGRLVNAEAWISFARKSG